MAARRTGNSLFDNCPPERIDPATLARPTLPLGKNCRAE
jgi:hypothetical protein